MSEHTYQFNVAMSCSGCSGAVERVLKKLDGVKSFDVDLKGQTAEVITADDSLEYNTVLSTIQKTGKKVNSGKADGQDMPVDAITS